MEEEFTTVIGVKIAYGILAVSFFIFTVYISIINYKGSNTVFITPVIGAIVVLLVGINLLKRKFIITDTSISYACIWSSKEILIKNIRGYRSTVRAIYIYPISSRFPKISIWDSVSLGGTSEFTEILKKTITDLDKAEYDADEEAILNNSNIGSTKEQREDRFENAKIYAIVYNISGIILFVLALMLRIESIILEVVLLLHPLFGLALIAITKGMIRLFAKLDSSAYRSIYLGVFLSELCLIASVLQSKTGYNHTNLWWQEILGGIVFLTMSIAVLFKMPIKVILVQAFFVILFTVGYAFGSALEISYIFK